VDRFVLNFGLITRMPLTASLSPLFLMAYRTSAPTEIRHGFNESAPGLPPGHHSWTSGRVTRTLDHLVRCHAIPSALQCCRRCLDASSTPSACPDAKSASPTHHGRSLDHPSPPAFPIKGSLALHAGPNRPCPPLPSASRARRGAASPPHCSNRPPH
jgi:hypothetical protein